MILQFSSSFEDQMLIFRCFVRSTVYIFGEGHKSLQNLRRKINWHCIGQIYGGDFAKDCELLRMYEL